MVRSVGPILGLGKISTSADYARSKVSLPNDSIDTFKAIRHGGYTDRLSSYKQPRPKRQCVRELGSCIQSEIVCKYLSIDLRTGKEPGAICDRLKHISVITASIVLMTDDEMNLQRDPESARW